MRCHGNGVNGSVLAPFSLVERVEKLSDEVVLSAIKNGKAGTQMRAFANLASWQRESLLLYLRSLR